jgi:hypothetical protein
MSGDGAAVAIASGPFCALAVSGGAATIAAAMAVASAARIIKRGLLSAGIRCGAAPNKPLVPLEANAAPAPQRSLQITLDLNRYAQRVPHASAKSALGSRRLDHRQPDPGLLPGRDIRLVEFLRDELLHRGGIDVRQRARKLRGIELSHPSA